jgi:hypothetical protein
MVSAALGLYDALGAHLDIAREDQESLFRAHRLHEPELLQRTIDDQERASSHREKLAALTGAGRKRPSDTVDGSAGSRHQ